jgi:hypothetical protein
MKFSLVPWVLLGLTCSSSSALVRPRSQKNPNSKTILPPAVTGDITANFKSDCSLDGPQLSAVNSSSWDWWYFDAVSIDAKSNVVIIFYTASSSGFPFLPPSPNVTLFELHSLLPNGTLFNVFIPAEEAVITTVGEGSSGNFKGTNASWTGTGDLKHYKIVVNSPANGVVGTFNLRSLAPGHYPCGPARSGENMMVAPEIGWANAVPDAVADVDFTLAGTKVAFRGVGYHDKVFISSDLVSSMVDPIFRTGAINRSPTMLRVGTGAMAGWDIIRSSGSTHLESMARNTSVRMSRNMIRSLRLVVRRGQSKFDQVGTARIHRRSVPLTQADSQLRSIWREKVQCMWRLLLELSL